MADNTRSTEHSEKKETRIAFTDLELGSQGADSIDEQKQLSASQVRSDECPEPKSEEADSAYLVSPSSQTVRVFMSHNVLRR